MKDFGTFSHCWSLCVEEHFYLLLPLTLIFLQHFKLIKRGYWLFIGLFLFGLAIRFYCFNHFYLQRIGNESNWLNWYKYIYYPTYSRLDGLLVGVAIASVYEFLPKFWMSISRYGNLFILMSLLVLTGAYFLCTDQKTVEATIFGFPLIAIGYGFMVIGAISETSVLYRWNSKTTKIIATLSYAIYLTHKGIIHITHQLLKDYKINENLMLLICMVTCVVFAVLLNLTMEKPFMKLRNRMVESE